MNRVSFNHHQLERRNRPGETVARCVYGGYLMTNRRINRPLSLPGGQLRNKNLGVELSTNHPGGGTQ